MSRWSVRSLIRSLMSRRRFAPRLRPPAVPCRPQVEALEDRMTPAALAGQLDLGFNFAGPQPGYHYLDLANGDFDGATALASYADGALIAAGTAGTGAASDFALARFNANGTLDTLFGNNGAVRTTFSVDTVDELNAMVLQPDGKIIVAGMSDGQFALARYHANGTLDRSFGNQGKVVSAIDGTIHGIALQQDGKIVAVGRIVDTANRFGIARFNADGSLDTAFGTGGVTVVTQTGLLVQDPQFGANPHAAAVVIQADGKIAVTGSTDVTGGNQKSGAAVVVRLKTDGSLDTSFNGNGVSVLMNNGSPFVFLDHSIGRAIDYRASDGALVISGSYKPRWADPVNKDDPGLFVAAFDNGGGLNHSFNNGQGVYRPELQVGSREYATSYAVKFDAVGRIVWGGEIVDINATNNIGGSYQVVGRLNANGTSDVTFGDHGVAVEGGLFVDGSPVAFLQNVRAVSLQPEGSLVTAGAYDNRVGEQGFVLSRFNVGADITVANAAGKEGDPGTPGSMVFTLSRHGGAEQAVRVYYQTVDGTAVAGTDYQATSGFVDFAVGQNIATVTVPLLPDLTYTPGLQRSFSLELTDTDLLATDLVFNPSQTFAGTETYAVAVADFNGDNLDDLVYAAAGDNQVNVLINQTEEGSATLSFASRVYAAGTLPQSVAVGDFDGDGDLDFVVGNAGDNTVSVYFNDGSGSFPTQISADSLGARPLDVQAADIDRDGKDDIVIANFGTAKGFPAGFEEFPDPSIQSGITVLAAWDDGQARFTRTAPIPVPGRPVALALADFNNDGYTDFAVAHGGGSRNRDYWCVSVTLAPGATLNDSQGISAHQVVISMGDAMTGIAAADFNSDGKTDLAAIGGHSENPEAFDSEEFANLKILINDTADSADLPSFSATTTQPLAVRPGYIDVSTGDLDRDGRPDLLVSALTDGHVLLCLNRHESGIDIPLDFDSVSLSTSLNQTVVADMNGDDLPDLVGASPHGNAAVIAVHTTAPVLGPAARGSILDDEAPARLAIVSGNNQSKQVGTGLFPETLIVEVQNANGNPVLSSSGWSVTFTSPLIAHAAFFGSFSGTFTDTDTNDDGQLSANVIAGARAGTYQISAVLDGHSGVEALFTMTNTPGVPDHVTRTGDDQSIWLGTDAPAPFTLTVLDQFNNPLPNLEVQFAAPGSGPSGTFGGALTVSVLTDASGRATAPDFTANSEVGSYQIAATVVNTGVSTTFDVFNDTATMTVVSGDNQSQAVASAFPQPLVIEIRNSAGEVVPNLAVTFATQSILFGGFWTSEVTFPTTTDANGRASAPLIAGTRAATFSVTVTADDLAGVSTSFTATTTPGAPVYFTSSGDGQRVSLGGTIAAPLSVTVFDFFDNRVPNAQVQFAAPPTGPSGSFGDQRVVTVLTNSLGVAVAPPFTANRQPGAYQVTGTVAGTSVSATFDITNLAADHFESGPWDEWRNRRGLVHRVGDFNNDGLDDIASFHRGSDRWKVGLAQPGGGFVTSEWADFSGNVSWTGHLVGDFNGDGFDDVAQFRRDTGVWRVCLSDAVNGQLRFVSQRWADLDGGWFRHRVGDFNGDGKADIASFRAVDGTWQVSLSDGKRFRTRKWADLADTGWTRQLAGDFNADGQTDMAGFRATTGKWYVGLSNGSKFVFSVWAESLPGMTRPLVGDFNGDGLDDLAGFSANSGTWHVGLSTGVGFATGVWATVADTGWGLPLVGDFTGEGLDDLASFDKESGAWHVLASNGTSGFTSTLWAELASGGWGAHLVGNFNGDAFDDIAGFSLWTGEWWASLAKTGGLDA